MRPSPVCCIRGVCPEFNGDYLMLKTNFTAFMLFVLPLFGASAQILPPPVPLAEGLSFLDDTTIKAPYNFLTDRPAKNEDGTVNAVVEIPTGTQAKWEVKDDGVLHWDTKDGKPRTVNFLPYLGNYGMVPGTLQGDGDPIDILVLAPAYPRGSIVPVKVIGALLFTDEGDQDNKIIAVVPGLPLGDLTSLAELDARYPEVAHIIQTWFEHYKGIGKEMICKGRVEKDEALTLVTDAANRFSTEKAPAVASKP